MPKFDIGMSSTEKQNRMQIRQAAVQGPRRGSKARTGGHIRQHLSSVRPAEPTSGTGFPWINGA